MPKTIPEEKKKEVQRLYEKGISMKDIAGRTGISYSSVYGLTRLRQRTNPETNKPYESLEELRDYNTRQRTNPETNRRYRSQKEYLEFRARQRINPETNRRYRSLYELSDYQARQRTNPETNRRYRSQKEYLEFRARQRIKRKKNKVLSSLVKKRLKKLEKNQSWLAQQLGITRAAVSLYVLGKAIPPQNKIGKLFSVLKVENRSKSLDDLIV